MRLPSTKSDMSGTARPAYTNGGCGAIRSTNFCRYCSSPQKPKTIHSDGTVLSGCSASDTLPDGWMRRSCPSGRQLGNNPADAYRELRVVVPAKRGFGNYDVNKQFIPVEPPTS